MKRLIEKMNANCARMRQLADLCENEKRERTEAEDAEYRELCRENDIIQMQMRAMQQLPTPESRQSATAVVRENIKRGVQTEFHLMRDGSGSGTPPTTPTLVYTGTTEAEAGGTVPARIEDVIKPLYEGLILSAVGLDLRTGLSGQYIWPVAEAVTAQIAGEAVELTKQKLSLSKITARPERIGVSMTLTRQAVIQSDGIVESLVTSLMPEAIAALINKVMFSVDKVTGATDNLKGPFVDKKTGATVLSSPGYKDFCKLKASVLKSGVPGTHLGWVMSKATAAELEGTPKDSGSGIMCIENGMLCGVPVFTTQYIGDDYIGIGDFTYQVMGLFGDMSFIVDPYSSAGSDMVNFHLNCNYGTATLRPAAFALAKWTRS